MRLMGIHILHRGKDMMRDRGNYIVHMGIDRKEKKQLAK